ncbi:MAG: hypothetical protein A3D47_00105 [Candidatus Colwellbacteria bacterium RIFCSPHIGHO2_02_FULL_43_15]|uniref:Cardiolipin synthase N-terminal domain-containing protein n=2 Tax=Candidatus Colwelliibacteriota TaxID=1817904 RepID=A0A1G1Z0G7_9BACT|nr:MAG: hypothetical protein A3D47_00105 [Candidatus Colwellbacteria bacterium RIFCSPHIGHO2_02_FULL_43_15]OGY61352.1 MAG: hypothetical protein A3F99_02495 [Candidatus Colwellbacteria bacterium RIFCSPLOWO2_12_FULL_43_11]
MGVILAILSGIVFIWLLVFALFVACFVFWIWMFIESIRSDYNNKPVWILVMILGNLLGAIAFYFAVYKKLKAGK